MCIQDNKYKKHARTIIFFNFKKNILLIKKLRIIMKLLNLVIIN